MNIYSVLPFSVPQYARNAKRLAKSDTTELGCAICGKAVQRPYQHTATIVNGGVWAIGPDCHRKYLVKPRS